MSSWLQTILALGLRNQLEVSPETGRLRVRLVNDDVWCALERIGGPEAVAARLRLSAREIQSWVDDHRVPGEYVEWVKRHTGFSKWSLQHPPFDLPGCREAAREEMAEDRERERLKKR